MFETLCKVNHLVIDKTGTLNHGNIEISIVETLDSLTKESCLAIAAELESHANHAIAKAFRPYKAENVMVSEVRNIIGSGIEGVFARQKSKLAAQNLC